MNKQSRAKKRVRFITSLSIVLLLVAAMALSAAASSLTQKSNPATLEKYVARYALDAGLIPISTLDVSLENGELWLKPSVLKKRKLAQKSANVFVDQVENSELIFNQGEDGKIASITFTYDDQRYTALRVLLPPPSLKGNTTFRLKGYKDAKIVALAGSFNTWNQSQHIFGREGGEWICRLNLELGKHAYKFIVDGNWLLDPDNPNTEEDEFGVINSLIIVPAASSQSPRP